MKQLVGKDIAEAEIRHGAPTNVIGLSDGRKAFQFASGGGVVPILGNQTTTVTAYGPTATIQSQGTPAAFIETPPCTLTYIARSVGERWVIDEVRVPKQLVC